MKKQQTLEMERVEQHFIRYLPDISYLYLDKNGRAYIGMGFHISSKSDYIRLPLKDKRTKKAVSNIDKATEFARIIRLPKGYAVNFYEPFGECYLSHNESIILLKNKIKQLIIEFKEQHAELNFAQLPAKVQLAVLDVAYDLTEQPIKHAYPDFYQAICIKNWPVAAQTCTRSGICKVRNNAVQALFKNLETPDKSVFETFKSWFL
ncbi:hypothetical protein [Pseudoalteromonas sp. Ld20]|uniref:hypothetical protein n=1 Tax=Pseudoalteromonas sp. Ld20 TaxID=649165 RepID=UPI00386CA4B8